MVCVGFIFGVYSGTKLENIKRYICVYVIVQRLETRGKGGVRLAIVNDAVAAFVVVL